MTTFGPDQADRHYDGLLVHIQKIGNAEHAQAVENA